MRDVLIGIQARSGSTRLPRKAFELIGGRMMLDRVIEAAKKAADYASHRHGRGGMKAAVLTPFGDPIAAAFANRCAIVEGPEHDVLARYVAAADRFESGLIVRLTGDCPMIPFHLVARMISLAIDHDYDYVSNVDGRFRTAIDGADCEVISRRLLNDLASRAVSPEDREHVTTLARRDPPAWANVGSVMGWFDHSDQKLSVDTPEDLARVRKACEALEEKHLAAIKALGNRKVHRI